VHAGDHLKLMFPMCWAVTQIALFVWCVFLCVFFLFAFACFVVFVFTVCFSVFFFLDGQEQLWRNTFEGKSNLEWAMKMLRFGVEYLLACHIKDDAFVVQVHLPCSCVSTQEQGARSLQWHLTHRSCMRMLAQASLSAVALLWADGLSNCSSSVQLSL
jgi:hypothetical protein